MPRKYYRTHWSDPSVWIGAAIIRNFIPGAIVGGAGLYGVFMWSAEGFFFALFALPLAGVFITYGVITVRATLRE